jgi:O-acetyl-ADP-ribose deacetylase (regulator of RNase III)
MIKYMVGDLLEAKEDIICHQVNCQGAFGAGIAKQIAKEYPESKKSYVEYCERYNDILGDCLVTKEDDLWVANLFGQDYYGRYGYYYEKYNRQTNYDALKKAMVLLVNEYPDKSYAFPYLIGCGLAGGDWEIVLGIIGDVFKDNSVVIYDLENKRGV